jgi:hypothetical protein
MVPGAALEPLAREFERLAHRLALRNGERQVVGRRQHQEISRCGAQDQVLLGGKQRELALPDHSLRLLVALDHLLAEDRLRDEQRLAVGGKPRCPCAEDRVLAAQDPLARLRVFAIEPHGRQESGLRLVGGCAGGTGFRLRSFEPGIAFQGEGVGLEQGFAVRRRRDSEQRKRNHGQKPPQSSRRKHSPHSAPLPTQCHLDLKSSYFIFQRIGNTGLIPERSRQFDAEIRSRKLPQDGRKNVKIDVF